MIDHLRSEIQERLDELLAEADKLRRALAALTGGNGSAPRRAAARPGRSVAKRRGRTQVSGSDSRGDCRSSLSASAEDGVARACVIGARFGTGAQPPRSAAVTRPRSARRDKSAVLAALSDGQAMTAGQVAAATGLGRATVSTTLSKLAKTGEVAKAERGYRRAESPSAK